MKILIALLLLPLASCVNKQVVAEQTLVDRNVAYNSRLVEGDKFILKFKEKIKIPFDTKRVTLCETQELSHPYLVNDAYLDMKDTKRTDRHIPAGTIIETVLNFDPFYHDQTLNNLRILNQNSQIERLILNGGTSGESFSDYSSLVKYFKTCLPQLEIIKYSPADLAGSIPVQ